MNDNLTLQLIASAVRHILTAVGGALITKGWLNANGLDDITAGVVILISLYWSYRHKQSTAGVISELKDANSDLQTQLVKTTTPPADTTKTS